MARPLSRFGKTFAEGKEYFRQQPNITAAELRRYASQALIASRRIRASNQQLFGKEPNVCLSRRHTLRGLFLLAEHLLYGVHR